MRSPLRIALDSPAGRFGLWASGAVACLRALGLILIAEAVARGITAAIAGEPVTAAVGLGTAGAVCQAAAAWAGGLVGAHSSIGAKALLRRGLLARVGSGSSRDLPVSDGALAVTATRTLDELDDYFLSVVPALTASIAVPLLVGARILLADWVSAVIIVITLPLVPVFMILIGGYTAERTQAATASLDRLSGHLVELARGVPVLLGLGRLPAQTAALREVADRYRETTLTALRVAFLSALALELIATISVALVAVFIGVRLVHGSMGLDAGLLALVLAPECYLPLRRLGAAFHSTENGMTAYERVREIADSAPAARIPPASGEPGAAVVVERLSVRYAGRDEDAVSDLTFTCPTAGLTVLTGPSGSGKSTVLAALAGLVRTDASSRTTGSVRVPDRLAAALQHPATSTPTVAEEIALRLPPGSPDAAIAECLGFACADLDPDAECSSLSAGELRRLALARAYASVLAGAELVLLDEPTAHLDEDTASAVRAHIVDLAARVPVLASTHDPLLIAAAAAEVPVASPGAVVSSSSSESASASCEAVPAADAAGSGESAAAVEPASASEGSAGSADAEPQRIRPAVVHRERRRGDGGEPPEPGLRETLARLRAAVDPLRPSFLLAVAAGVLSVAAGSALTGVSAWLIVEASFGPHIMTLLVAIVGVRFFGLSRSVLAYAQRLWLHDAVLASLGRLRTTMWAGLARTGSADRRLRRGEGAVRSLIADVDDIRDLVPRVVLPPLIAGLVACAAAVVLTLVHPLAGLVSAVASVLALGPAAWLAARLDARAAAERLRLRAGVLTGVLGLLGARSDLLADSSWPRAAARVLDADAAASADERRIVRSEGAGAAVVTLLGAGAAVAMIAVLGPLTAAGELAPQLLAVAVLLPLGLIDSQLDSCAAVQQWPALRSVLARVDELSGDRRAVRGDSAEDGRGAATGPPESVDALACEDLAVGWSGSGDLFSGLTADLPVPGTTLIAGPSGSGKTTLISVLMRFAEPTAGRVLIGGEDAGRLSADDLAGRIAWCPQEAHVFDSTIRGNLLIARDRADAPSEEEMRSALRRAGLGDLVEEIGLDGRTGPGGVRLSGGQRQRLALARTLLVGADVVILDEPTAHLDEETAARMLADVGSALRGCGTVIVSHDPALRARADVLIDLS